MSLPVVRLSRGSFEPAQFIAIRNRLDESRNTLVPAIKALRGCLHFWAAADAVSNTMINVSIWATLDDAKQLDTLSAMLALATEFTKLGVKFERPIVNYESLWEI